MLKNYFSYNNLLIFFLLSFLYFSYFSNFLFKDFIFVEEVQIFMLLLVLIFMFFRMSLSKINKIITFLCICLFLCVLYLPVILNDNFVLDYDKSIRFLLIFVFCGIVGIFFTSAFNIEKLVLGFYLISSVFVILSFLYGDYSSSGTSRVVLGDMNPIWNARLIGVCLLYSLLQLFIFNKFKLMYVFLALLSCYTIYLTGSRGPMLAVFISFLVVLNFIKFSLLKRILFNSLFIFTSLFIYLFIIERTLILSQINLSDLSSGRLGLYEFALNLFISNPFGIGLGGFERQFNVDRVSYPHNLILESLVEAGLLFTIVFFAIIFFSLIKASRISRNNFGYYIFLFSFLIYSLVNAMLSGDLTSPKELYILVFFFLFTFKNKVNH